MTVLEVIQRSAEFLAKKGVDSPRLQAELLLAHVLRLPRMQLYLNFERVLAPAEQDTLRELVVRRGGREPLQHILGSTCFCGLEIFVNGHVLVPRPETEILAEQGWLFLNQRSRPAAESGPGQAERDQAVTVLDFGTGSGCLAIALAVKCSAAQITALDLSPEALEVAGNNAVLHRVLDRIHLLQGEDLSSVPRDQRFDLIIANPPYIPTSEIDELQPEVRNFDPRLALDGGPDGLSFYRHLATAAGGLLKPEGKLMLEFGYGQEKQLPELFGNENWIVEAVLRDYTERPRVLIAYKKIQPGGLN